MLNEIGVRPDLFWIKNKYYIAYASRGSAQIDSKLYSWILFGDPFWICLETAANNVAQASEGMKVL